MSESMNPEVVTKFEHDTWSRCAQSYLDTFAGMTRETIPLNSTFAANPEICERFRHRSMCALSGK